MNIPSILHWKSFGKVVFNTERFIPPKISGLKSTFKGPLILHTDPPENVFLASGSSLYLIPTALCVRKRET